MGTKFRGQICSHKRGQNWGQNPIILLQRNSQASEKIKTHQEKDFLLQNYQSDL